jgi:hypothetical protein
LDTRPKIRVRGPAILDHTGALIARHNGHRWEVKERRFYRVDCTGPVVVKLEVQTERTDAAARGPFEHFSLVNGTAYASREVFAHYNEQDAAWHLHESDDARSPTLLVTPA